MTAFAWCVGPAAALAPPLPSRPEPMDFPHLRRARAAAAARDLHGAIAHFEAALQEDPRCGMAHLGLAMCHAGLGHPREARFALQKAIVVGEPAPHVALQLSRLAAREGDDALAMDLLAHVLDQQPGLVARIETDAAFGHLRDHPRFLVILGRL